MTIADSASFSSYFESDNKNIIKGNRGGEIFGISIASNDINRDGYDDLVIGAPYANDNQAGAVFVYYGSESGINVDNYQKLESNNLTDIHGFGHKIALEDFDSNEYVDVIVATEEPKPKVFAYHSRPSVDITFVIQHPFHMKNSGDDEHDHGQHDTLYLPESDDKQEVIEICIKYNGIAVPDQLHFKSHISLDVDYDSPHRSLRRLVGTFLESFDVLRK